MKEQLNKLIREELGSGPAFDAVLEMAEENKSFTEDYIHELVCDKMHYHYHFDDSNLANDEEALILHDEVQAAVDFMRSVSRIVQ